MMRFLANRVDEAAVAKARVENYMVRFANDEVTAFKSWTVENTYLYLAKGRRTTFVSTTGSPSLAQVEEALKALENVPEDPLYVPLGGPQPVNHEEALDDFEKLPDLVKRAIDGAHGVERSAGAALLSYVTVEYEDTAGRKGRYSVNRVYLTMRSFLGELSATSAVAARRVAEIKAEHVGEQNAQLLSLAKGLPHRRAEAGRADLLLSPLVFGHLMGEVAHFWANGLEVVSGGSRYSKDDVGKAVASPALTVVDKTYDPTAYGFTPFDSEGVPPRPVAIYERGVLGGFLHTRRTAAALGTEPTGHALGSLVRPAPGHLEVGAGDAPGDLEELFAELKNGFYIHNNWYTRYQNVKTGQFSTVGRDVALEVRDGGPVAVVKFIRIADTLENVVKNVEALSKKRAQVYWWDMPAPATSAWAILRNIGITT